MDFSYLFLGSYSVVLRADDFKRFFGICMYHGIHFSKLLMIDDDSNEHKQCSCRIRCDRYSKLKDIAQKTNVDIEITKKHGIPVLMNKIKLHSYFFTGAVMALFLLISLSHRLWDIRFEGNCFYGKEKLERFLTKTDIICGMQINKIDCAQISALIRENFPRITWASAEINGCNLIIHLKENRLIEPEDEGSTSSAYDLTAEKNGIIQEILVRNGIAQAEVGQSVSEGDILISGYIPIKNDAMEITAYQNTVADGQVWIQCEYAYYDEIQRKQIIQKVVKENSLPLLQIGKVRLDALCLTKPKTSEDSKQYLDEIISEKVFSLTDSFHLPVRIGQKKYIIYENDIQHYTDAELEKLANQHFWEFCSNLEKKGVQIYENNVKMELSDASCTMSGKVTVIEKTGVLRLSQKPEDYSSEMEE